jgi:competence protein ComEC
VDDVRVRGAVLLQLAERGGSLAPRPGLWALRLVALALMAGQALAPVLPGRLPWQATAGLTILLLLARRTRLATAVAVVVAAAIGHGQVDSLLRPALSEEHVAHLAGRTLEVRGRLVERPSRRASGTRLLLEVAEARTGGGWRAARGRVLVTVRRAEIGWMRGDELQGWFRLRRPRNFGNPGEFDYESFLARQGIYVTGFAASDRGWTRRGSHRLRPGTWLERWRGGVAETIEATLAEPQRQLVRALLLGDGGALGVEVRERYARAGVSHILSISGLHVSLVVAVAYAASRWLLGRSERLLLRANVPKIALLLSLPPVLAYAAVAGGSTPTLRAVVMIVLLLAGTLLDRRRDWVTTLAAAALAINLCWPGSLFEASFQLSFVAVLSIVLGMRRVAVAWRAWEERRLLRLRPGRWEWLRWCVLYEAVTLCAVAGTAPLGAWHFHRVSLVALLANALAVPVLGWVPVALGLLAVFIHPLSSDLSAYVLAVVGAVVAAGDLIVRACAALPGAAPLVPTPNLIELTLAYAALGGLLVTDRRRRRLVLALCAGLAAADTAYWYVERFHRTDLRVTFLSVGQGDSAVVEFPGSEVMVVDGGGLSATFDVGERIVAPYLWTRKIGAVDTLVLSHAQFDHYGGLGFLAAEVGARALWWNGMPGSGKLFDAFLRAVRENGVDVTEVRRGFQHRVGGVEIVALAPEPSFRGDLNDGSLALRLRYGPTSILFAGDLEVEGERRLLAAASDLLPSTILKVPHHGSRTSSTAAFLEAVAPTHAVVSAGHDNRFGMPHPEVVAAYRERGVRLWRTDRHGAVAFRIGAGGDVEVRPMRHGLSSLDTIDEARLKRGVDSSD